MGDVWRPESGQCVQLHSLKTAHANETYGVVLGRDASQDAADAWDAGRVPVQRADLRHPLALKAENLRPAPFLIRPVEGKGMGALATRDIGKGERILLEPPLFSVPAGKMRLRCGPEDLQRVSQALAALSPRQLDAFRELSASNTYLQQGMPMDMAKFETNALPLGEPQEEPDRGIFVLAARLNHSCQPNVEHCWNPTLKGETLHAAVDVRAGEELTLSYLGEDWLFRPREQRLAYLSHGWGFECRCEPCSLEGAQLAASDRRRSRLAPMADKIYQAVSHTQVLEGLRLVEETLALLQEEGLDIASLCGPRAYDAYQACKAVHLHSDARVWLQRASDWNIMCRGPDGKQQQQYNRLLKRKLGAPHVHLM
eukprot:jgi/Tetstr1/448005/TSEL_035307.t1